MVIHLNLSIGDSLGLWYSLLKRNKSALRQSPCHVRLHWPNPRFEWILWLEGSLQRFQRASNQSFGDPWGILFRWLKDSPLVWMISMFESKIRLDSLGFFGILGLKDPFRGRPIRSWAILEGSFSVCWRILDWFWCQSAQTAHSIQLKRKKYYPSKEMLSIVFE